MELQNSDSEVEGRQRVSLNLAAPKSANLTVPFPSERIFAPCKRINLIRKHILLQLITFMSLCTKFLECKYTNPCMICLTNFLIKASSNFPNYLSIKEIDPPVIYSM